MKKFLILLSLFSLCASLLAAQSLVDLSKKEKERREKLKGKTAIVLTNTDLKKTQKSSAILAPSPSQDEEEEAPETDEGEETTSSNRIIPSQRTPQEDSTSDVQANTEDISPEEKWEKAKEYVSLLTLKMNALWQDFYSMNDMTPRDHIQQQISETYQKLQKAKEEEEKLRQELDR